MQLNTVSFLRWHHICQLINKNRIKILEKNWRIQIEHEWVAPHICSFYVQPQCFPISNLLLTSLWLYAIYPSLWGRQQGSGHSARNILLCQESMGLVIALHDPKEVQDSASIYNNTTSGCVKVRREGNTFAIHKDVQHRNRKKDGISCVQCALLHPCHYTRIIIIIIHIYFTCHDVRREPGK